MMRQLVPVVHQALTVHAVHFYDHAASLSRVVASFIDVDRSRVSRRSSSRGPTTGPRSARSWPRRLPTRWRGGPDLHQSHDTW